MTAFWISLAVWIGAGIGAAGFLNADLRDEYPSYCGPERRFALLFSIACGLILGPVALALALLSTWLGTGTVRTKWSMRTGTKELS